MMGKKELHLILYNWYGTYKTTLKEHYKFTKEIQAKTPMQQTLVDAFIRKEKYPGDSDMAKNITEQVIKWISG